MGNFCSRAVSAEQECVPLYLPLSTETPRQIRLLTIQPGDGPELRCDLRVVDFTDEPGPFPEYETISYVWGDASIEQTMTVNGRPKQVPASSAVVLRRVRLRDMPRTVWIDALCINQIDEAEREQQVKMMGEIYANGLRNLVFLVSEEDYQDEMLDSVRKLLETARMGGYPEQLFDENGVLQFSNSDILRSQYDTLAMVKLCSSPWFQVWTFQESYLAKSNICLCGPREIDLLDLLRALGLLQCDIGYISSELALALQVPIEIRGRLDPVDGQRQALGPLGVVHTLRDRQCKWPVDRVYGGLGLMPDLKLVPDYSKSEAAVYQDFAVSIVRKYQHLGLLRCVLHSADRPSYTDQTLPSWVPDWSQRWVQAKHPVPFNPSFRADWDIAAGVAVEVERGGSAILSARGIELGSVAVVAQSWWANRPISAGNVDEAAAMIESACRKSGCDDDVDLVVATTLCAEIDWQSKPVTAVAVVAGYRVWRERLRQGLRIPEFLKLAKGDPEDVVLASQYESAVSNAITLRRLFSSSHGRVGVGPKFMQHGDIVAILYGYDQPVLLRPIEGRYRYLDDAYVYGTMFGEAVKEHKQAGREDKVFEIC